MTFSIAEVVVVKSRVYLERITQTPRAVHSSCMKATNKTLATKEMMYRNVPE